LILSGAFLLRFQRRGFGAAEWVKEISDYTDYETMTQIQNILKIMKNPCNHFFRSLPAPARR